jgi:hypothetical protein
MLRQLCGDHLGSTRHFYFALPFDVTVARHSSRPLSKEVTVEQLRSWYRHRDVLPFDDEHIIDETSSLDDTVTRIISAMNWEDSVPRSTH